MRYWLKSVGLRRKPNTLCSKRKFTYEQKLAFCVAIWEEFYEYELGRYRAPEISSKAETKCITEKVLLNVTNSETIELKVKLFECPMSRMKFEKKADKEIDNFYLARGINVERSAIFKLVEVGLLDKVMTMTHHDVDDFTDAKSKFSPGSSASISDYRSPYDESPSSEESSESEEETTGPRNSTVGKEIHGAARESEIVEESPLKIPLGGIDVTHLNAGGSAEYSRANNRSAEIAENSAGASGRTAEVSDKRLEGVKNTFRRRKKTLKLVSWHYGGRISEIMKMKYFFDVRYENINQREDPVFFM